MSNHWLHIYSEADITAYSHTRENEQRFWQTLSYLQPKEDLTQALRDAAQFGIKYVLVAINEDLGPRANCGRGGAHLGWQAFLQRFLNLPCNRFLTPNDVLLLGEVRCDDLQQQGADLDNRDTEQLAQLRTLNAQLDERVSIVMKAIFDAGLTPIVIGGGHNNCFGLLQALAQSSQQACQAINFDPHADFRALEGRHSGNGFSYAYEQGYLSDYHVVGMHEQKNNHTIISALDQAGFSYSSYQDILVRRKLTLTEACNVGLRRFAVDAPLGVEVDVDAISGMPVSAYTNCGFTVNDAEHFVHMAASQDNARYLHLCEAAPEHHPQGLQQGISDAGQVLASLVCSYLQARKADV
ncbi:formimidoylglutamase [Pseudoalteromonas rubra]|uniref:Arginase n=1 Tax=Pseudoalteromonas rubra TaxID=43658 RepID=A0A5S3WX75_9GAMM|nr:formimidoylglutamase [Pseudoalteromonas rubra]TMP35060.1 arginase [Pseudoalteromonas rubra]